MTQQDLLTRLSSNVAKFIDTTEKQYLILDEATLNGKQHPHSWSMLECLEHLNRYSRYYNPRISESIRSSPATDEHADVTPSWIGRKFIEMMHPSNTKKQRTIRRMDPRNSALTPAVIHEFLRHQQDLLEIIREAMGKDLNKGFVRVEFLKLIKLTPAEALEFVVVHQQRHFLQLNRLLQNSVTPALHV